MIKNYPNCCSEVNEIPATRAEMYKWLLNYDKCFFVLEITQLHDCVIGFHIFASTQLVSKDDRRLLSCST